MSDLIDDRALEFLRQSDALDGISNIEYLATSKVGHVGAFIQSQRLAKGEAHLELDDFRRWQRLVVEEQAAHGIPIESDDVDSPEGQFASPQQDRRNKLAELLQDTNGTVAQLPPQGSIVQVTTLIADQLYRFEEILPFLDGNGRVGRLFANYVATACNVPIIVFRPTEVSTLVQARQRKLAMRIFIATKLREAIFDFRGLLMLRVASFSSADRYRSEDGTELLVEQHELLDAVDTWRRQLEGTGRTSLDRGGSAERLGQ